MGWPWSRKRESKPSGIALEIERLERKIATEDDRMSDLSDLSDRFFREGGVCCPSCGEPGYSELQMAQERREKWLAILRKKAQKGRQTCL